MGRSRPLGVVTVVVALLSATITGAAQEEVSTTAIIRGEHIWLRAEPAEETDILAYLQRGDAVTITGEAVEAEGETFVPVDVDATGDVGWVRELAIDPRSIVQHGPAVEDEAVPATRREPRQPRVERTPRDVTVTPVPGDPQTVEGDEQAPTRREPRQPRAERTPSGEVETPRPEKPQRINVTPKLGGDCDPSYPSVCIPPPPPDLDCPQVADTDFAVLPPDPHGFDGNDDGVGCESG